MPTTQTLPEAQTQTSAALGRDILAFLQDTGKRYRPVLLAEAYGLGDDAGWERFQAALKTIPARLIIRVRGQGGFIQAA